MDNVIQFPDKKKEKDEVEELLSRIDEFDEQDPERAHELIAEDLTSDVVAECQMLGLSIGGEDYIADINLIYESIFSLICKLNGKHHPAQDFAQGVYDHITGISQNQLEFDF